MTPAGLISAVIQAVRPSAIQLVSLFYKSIQEATPLPVPYKELLLTSRIMDASFDQIGSERMLKAEIVVRQGSAMRIYFTNVARKIRYFILGKEMHTK
jgi:hypothetical protein